MSTDAVQRFRDFVWVIPEVIIMPLAIYIDEAGTHDETGKQPGSAILAVGGYIGWRDDWLKFAGEWEQVLCDYGVDAFHAVEFMRDPDIQEKDKDSPYRYWSDEKRERYVLDLAKVARSHAVRGLVTAVILKDYNTIFPDWLRQHLSHPYTMCLQTLYLNVINEWDKLFPKFHRQLSIDTQLAFVFDRVKEFNKIATLIHTEHSAEEIDKQHRIGSFTIASSRTATPLQASDLLCYRMVKRIAVRIKTDTFPKPGSWDKELGADDILKVIWHSPETLRKLLANEEKVRGLPQGGLPTS